MSAAALVVLLVAAERLAELIYAARNTRRLLACGGIEHGAAHYPLIVLLHAASLISVYLFAARDEPPVWFWIAVYLVLQAARAWTLASLGPSWTTRIVTVPGAPLVRRGPYRWIRHPNYAIVVAEIAVLPLAFREIGVALVFSALNAAMLAVRIRCENGVLAERR